MKKNNSEIRKAIVLNDLRHWEVAEALGMHDSNFARLLRKELPETKKLEILTIIKNLSEKQSEN